MEYRLIDDGTSDTVIEYYCSYCKAWHAERFNMPLDVFVRRHLLPALRSPMHMQSFAAGFYCETEERDKS